MVCFRPNLQRNKQKKSIKASEKIIFDYDKFYRLNDKRHIWWFFSPFRMMNDNYCLVKIFIINYIFDEAHVLNPLKNPLNRLHQAR